MKPKVCYVVNSVSETSVPATIATALVDYEGLQVDILAWFDAEPFAGDDRVDVTVLNAPRSTTDINRTSYREARTILREYDVIQANQNHAGSISKIIGYRLGIPLVSREGNVRRGFTRLGRIANGVTNAFADRIVPNSQAVYDSFMPWERLLIDDETVRIIPNGVDLGLIDRVGNTDFDIHDQFRIPQSAVVVGTASVISEQKALDVLVESIAIANEQSTCRLDLVIAGDGPLRSEIEEITQRLGIQKYIHFVGMVNRKTIYQILSEIDIYAMPSRWEGFSSAAVEALGAGNPCVFSDIDPFLIPYRNVALFHHVDDEIDLASNLIRLAEDSDLRDIYRQRGRELVEQEYTIELIAQQYAELYDEIV